MHDAHAFFVCFACVQGRHEGSMLYGCYNNLAEGQRPRLRTHASVLQQADKIQDAMEAPHRARGRATAWKHPEDRIEGANFLGVTQRSPFFDLPGFNIVKDTVLDMMHVTSNVAVHIMGMLCGKRLKDQKASADKRVRDLLAKEAKEVEERTKTYRAINLKINKLNDAIRNTPKRNGEKRDELQVSAHAGICMDHAENA